MKKSKKIEFIIRQLNELYPAPEAPLSSSSPYTHLIAVLLSAQCTDARVNMITPKLFSLAHTAERMITLSVKEIEQIIRPCGLAPKKSKAIYELSKILCNDYSGIVPENLESLESLPGVGHKTAQVVMAQCFQVPMFPVDTHIHRLAYRWGLSNGRNVVQTEKDCKRLFPREKWNDLHLQIIFYGRESCPARGHIWASCLICSVAGRRSLIPN